MKSSVLAAACAVAVSLLAAPAIAGESAKKAAPVKTAAKPAAAAPAAGDKVTPVQLEIAHRVMTGTADCEFDQKVTVQPLEGRPGVFKVGFKDSSYTMVPQETTTGAVRLEDKQAGVLWLQIPAKSMLLDNKAGHRLVDSCRQREQRAAL
jgi:hypothetical protein